MSQDLIRGLEGEQERLREEVVEMEDRVRGSEEELTEAIREAEEARERAEKA